MITDEDDITTIYINQPKKINSVLEHTNLALPLLAIIVGPLQTQFIIIPDKQKEMI